MTLTQLQSPRKKFLSSINYFRGIAIVLIVLGHCYDLSHWDISSVAEKIFYSTTLNGSVYFVFISGFLYYHVFYHKFNFKKFMVKKTKYIVIPYVFFSTLPILYEIFANGGGEYLPIELKNNHLLAAAWYLITGRVTYAYWYIPMAILLFAISPIINKIIKSQNVLIVSLFLLPISLIVHRSLDNLNPIHSLVYFLPVYLIGIWSSINHQKIVNYLKSKMRKLILLVMVFDLGAVQILLFQEPGNFHKQFWSITVPDINLLQKILLCFLIMSMLNRYENTDFTVIKKTAETSFAIYFIHPLLINAVISVLYRLNIDYEGSFLLLIFATCMVTAVSMAIALGFKTVFKENSRYLIGW
jgi:probable poly-beta-1,6-N-acetyl-D-glucosamine export protein